MKIKHLGIQSRIYAWVEDSLFDRTRLVRVVNTLSKPFNIENGVPQGSVISPNLVLIVVNGMADLLFTTGLSQFADDASLHKASTYLKFAFQRVHRK